MNPAVSPAASLHDTAALYRRHWPAMCAYARAKGCETHDAEDAVQELFARLVAQGQHERAAAIADPDEQAAFLLARLRTHLIKRWRHRTRLRRGGGMVCFSLSDENGANIDIADTHATPDAEMDRAWARNVIDGALSRVNGELQAQGREDVWQCLERTTAGRTRHGTALSGALRVALHRAKRRLRTMILQQCRSDDDAFVLQAVLA